MAEYVFTNGYFAAGSTAGVGGTLLSDHVREVRLRAEVDLRENSAMGLTWRRRIAGLADWTLEVVFNQDFAAGEVDATIWALLLAAAAEITCRADGGAVSATNPNYYGNALLQSYGPIDGAHGEEAGTSATFVGAGTLTQATS